MEEWISEILVFIIPIGVFCILFYCVWSINKRDAALAKEKDKNNIDTKKNKENKDLENEIDLSKYEYGEKCDYDIYFNLKNKPNWNIYIGEYKNYNLYKVKTKEYGKQYLLRCNKLDGETIIFGEVGTLCCIFRNYIVSNYSLYIREDDEEALKTIFIDIETGERKSYFLRSHEHTLKFVNGYGRFYNQYMFKEMYVEDDKLVIEGEKSPENDPRNKKDYEEKVEPLKIIADLENEKLVYEFEIGKPWIDLYDSEGNEIEDQQIWEIDKNKDGELHCVVKDDYKDTIEVIEQIPIRYGKKYIVDMSGMFEDCSELIIINTENVDTSHVTNMGNMFSGCKRLIDLDLSSFDTSHVIKMYNMFRDCENLISINLENFDMSNVGWTRGMFYRCRNLEEMIFPEGQSGEKLKEQCEKRFWQ